MLSRRDLIHSRQYLRQRQVKALLAHRPDPLDWAGRGGGVTAFVGVMILVIALAATAVIGLFFPGGAKSWQSCEKVIVEKETGAVFVCDPAARALHPVANFASAALILGDPAATQVSRKSLTWARGAALGLPGAPADLVPAANYLTGAWSLCAAPGRDAAGRSSPVTVILAGAQPVRSTPLADRALLLAAADGTRYLLWNGHRFPIRDPQFVLPALGFSTQEGIAVGDAWLGPIPLGADLAPIDVVGAGAALPGFGHAPVGGVARVAAADGADRYYLVRPTGLQELTPLQRALVRDPRRTPSPKLTAADIAGVPILAPLSPGGFPPPPDTPSFARLAAADRAICAIVAGEEIGIAVEAVLPARAATVTARPAQPRGGPALADAVLVEPGHAVLVQTQSGALPTGGALMLVTDLGVRHPCASDDVPEMLGYTGAAPVRLPAALVERVPQGVTLDPARARSSVDSFVTLASSPGGT